MGKSCSCLHSYPTERKQRNIHPSQYDPRTIHPPLPSPINIDCQNIHTATNRSKRNYLRCTQNEPYARVHTLSSAFIPEFEPQSIHDAPPSSSSSECFDAEQLQMHRIITVGYLANQLPTNVCLPLSVIGLIRQYYFALKPIRRKRVVFTSIVQLNLCIDEIPAFILNESIFFFKVNKAELLDVIHSDLHAEEGSLLRMNNTRNSSSFINDLQPLFREYLKKKYEDHLLLIMDGDDDWNAISKQLISIEDIWYDHEQSKYKKLLLNETFWMHNKWTHFKYDVDSVDVIDEIAYNELKYAPTMEILWQSNPSLIPMRRFDMNQYHAENGYNTEYIVEATSTILEAEADECELITTPSNADLVVLSMYNSGNDFSEISKTSYCDELSYTAHGHMYHTFDAIPIPDTSHFNNNSGCNLCQRHCALYKL
eukprot:276062_1